MFRNYYLKSDIMNDEEKKKTLDRYNERLKVYGYDPKTLGWLKGKQEIRFQVLSEIGNLQNCSVLDVGCGFGDLYGFFHKKRIKIKYTGVDINSQLLEIGMELYPSAVFEEMDFEEFPLEKKFDWAFASGIFNFKLKNNDQFIKNTLSKMFSLSKKGVAVDFLSSYVDFQNGGAYYSNPEQIFSFCKKLSRRITLRHDYMPFEFCIYIYKNDEFNEKTVFTGYNQEKK